jgi:glycosyltransferase involved in cell wall biosynthesis
VRVLQVDSGREWRGGQNQVRLLCRELAREPTVELRLVTRRDCQLSGLAQQDGVRVREAPWSIGLDPRAWFTLVLEIAEFRPDVVHANDSHALQLAAWALPWARVPIAPRIVGSRRVDFHIGRLSRWRSVDRVIAISEAVKGILVSDGVPATEITVVPSGIDADEVRRAAATPLDIRRRLGLGPGTPVAVNVAALVDHKDQHTLIHAARHARTLRPDLHWAIAGEGDRRGSLEAEIARLELRDRVHLLGYVDAADALIREANVFVMSSKEEGLGSVILNALALEKPVVATAGGGIPEILPPEALVPVGDAAGLARKVVEALTHPASRIPLPERFTAQAMAQGVLAVYRSLL